MSHYTHINVVEYNAEVPAVLAAVQQWSFAPRLPYRCPSVSWQACATMLRQEEQAARFSHDCQEQVAARWRATLQGQQMVRDRIAVAAARMRLARVAARRQAMLPVQRANILRNMRLASAPWPSEK
jgi:hypothetical protein